MKKTVRTMIPVGSLLVAVLTMSPAQAEFIAGDVSELTGLGDLAGGADYSEALGINADGSSVVGVSTGVNGTEAMLWTASGGMVGLGDLAGGMVYSVAYDVTDDGSMVVGYSISASGTEAMYWTSSTGMVGLGDLAGGVFSSYANGVSADGSVIVGNGVSASGGEAWRWTSGGGMVGLGDLAGGAFSSYARATSADGSVVVGYGTSASGTEAMRWTSSSGMVGLGDLAGGAFESKAYNVSADGSVVVGYSRNAIDQEAFRWTAATGMVGLGDLNGANFIQSEAYAVSADGNVVVGYSDTPGGSQAFYWTVNDGMESVADILSAAGVNTTGWDLSVAYDVSDDGTLVVGTATNPSGDTEAFMAKISPIQAGLISVRDFQTSVDEIRVGQQLMGHVNRYLAHSSLPTLHRQQGFRAAPVVSYVKGSEAVSGGVALGWQLDGLTLSGRFGALTAEDEVRYGGDTSYDGFWYSLGVASQLGDLTGLSWLSGLELSVAVQAGNNNADIDRKYYNGATLENSEGDTDLDSLTTTARLGWRFKMSESLALTPYVQVLHNETSTDSYMETGGTFPGLVHDQRDTATENSFGASLGWQLSESIALNAWAAWVDMHNESGSDITIDVAGLGTFTSPGMDYDESWADLGLGATWQMTDSMALSAEVGGTDGSNYPEDWHASLGLSYIF